MQQPANTNATTIRFIIVISPVNFFDSLRQKRRGAASSLPDLPTPKHRGHPSQKIAAAENSGAPSSVPDIKTSIP
jgi:hypothetical protein